MTDHDKKRRAMDEIAHEIITLETLARLPRISNFRITNELLKQLSILQITEPVEFYLVGSKQEGFPDSATDDIDQMVCITTFPMVMWESRENERGKFIIAEQVSNESPFCRLKVTDKECLHKDFRSIINKDGYLKTSDFIKNTYSSNFLRLPAFEEDYKTEIRHGPSITTKYNSKYVDIKEGTMDFVHCLKCQSWPPFTNDFFNRNRRNNWPSQKLLDKVKGLRCHIVPVGYPGWESSDTEWRLSFSIAETELITEFYEPYAKCMLTLKCIKKKYIKFEDSVKPTPFSSYFIKTACLWMCETFPHTDYSVMNLIRQVLDWLIDCYQRRHLPHYFIPEHNLIGHLPFKFCDNVRENLTAFKENLWIKVISSVSYNGTDSWDSEFKDMCEKLNIIRENGDDEHSTLEATLIKHPETIECLCSRVRSMFDLAKKVTMEGWAARVDPLTISLVQYIQNNPLKNFSLPEKIVMPVVDNIEEIVPKEYGEMFKTCLYRYIGDIYTHLLVGSRNEEALSHYRNTPLHYYTLGAKMDFPDNYSDHGIGGEVLKVKYHYLMGNYTELKQACDSILSKYSSVESNCWLAELSIMQVESPFARLYSGWVADDKLLHCVKHSDIMTLSLHPITLILYIKARVLLTEGDKDNALNAVKEMKKYLDKAYMYMYHMTIKMFITIIESLVAFDL